MISAAWGKPEQTNCASVMGEVVKRFIKPSTGVAEVMKQFGKQSETGADQPGSLGDPSHLQGILEQFGFMSIETK